MSGKSVEDLNVEMEIGVCTKYGNNLFNLLREKQKSSTPSLIFISRIRAAVHDLLADEEKIKRQISLCISKEDSDTIVGLFRKIEKIAHPVLKNEMPKRPIYLGLMMRVI